jgi:HEPN domain-containing protein
VAQETPWLNAAAFHAQQAAEKFLKAFLVRHQIEFPKTHDVGELLDLVMQVDAPLAESLAEAVGLSPFGTVTRYPSDLPDLSLEEARRALALATRVRAAIMDSLRSYLGQAPG